MSLNSGDKTTQGWKAIKLFIFCEAPYEVELKSAVTLDYTVCSVVYTVEEYFAEN